MNERLSDFHNTRIKDKLFTNYIIKTPHLSLKKKKKTPQVEVLACGRKEGCVYNDRKISHATVKWQ